MSSTKIVVEVWSDIVCPFCYIGKRNFEQGAKHAGLYDSVRVEWRSFELAPDAVTNPEASIYDVLAQRKGWSPEQSRQIHAQMEERAKASGLTYDFERTVPANSRKAHRLLHIAKSAGVQYEVKELLLKGYFTDGKNIDDEVFLVETGVAAGIPAEQIRSKLYSPDLDQAVDEDIRLARKYGIQGVPFFVVNQKYGLSGAQPPEVLKEMLEQVAAEATTGTVNPEAL